MANYQRHKWDTDEMSRKKTSLAIVDYFPGGEAEKRFRSRYRFVDWSRADLRGNGFDLPSLNKIFA